MAHIYGGSQAWGAVLAKLGGDAVGIDTPEALRKFRIVLEARQPTWRSEAETQTRNQIAELAGRSTTLTVQIEDCRQVAQEVCRRDVTHYGGYIRELQAQRGLFRWLYNKFWEVPEARRRIARAQRQLEQAGFVLIQEQRRCSAEKARLEADFQQIVGEMVRREQARLDVVVKTLASPELAGASAELEMAALLARLPDDFSVFHDLPLDLYRYIPFDGGHLKTAQCDHVVVGLPGVFVIETKRWSQNFAEGTDHFDPFKQVGRARFLCQCLLRDCGYEITPRDIIANAGAYLSKPNGAYTKVLRPEAVVSYIRNHSSEHPLSCDQVAGIVSVLQRFVAARSSFRG